MARQQFGSFARLFLVTLAVPMLVGTGACTTIPGDHERERLELDARVREITDRPQYRHSRFGMLFYSLTDQRVILERNSDQFFVPGSTAKLYPAGAALVALGPDYRFRTEVFQTGPVVDGTLEGDLVLVASGDFNLSNRLRPQERLSYTSMDHSYDMVPGAAVVEGDPLLALRGIADQVRAAGIERIEGYVRIDTSLFDQGSWAYGATSDVAISPIVINDNIVDITVAPAPDPGSPASLHIAPDTGYVQFVNQTNTVAQDGLVSIQLVDDSRHADGTRTVTVAGNVPVGHSPVLRAYRVPEPPLFAETALAAALRHAAFLSEGDFKGHPDSYTVGQKVAEHVSPPLSEAVKVILKVSQNLHAASLPYVLGAIVEGDGTHSNAAGFTVQRKVFEAAGLDLTGAVQSDGAGVGARYTPAFAVRFLEYMSREPYFTAFLEAMPILGTDGTLHDTQRKSLAAGNVYAKTGTDGGSNLITQTAFLNGKGLSGYMAMPDGDVIAFAVYSNLVPVRDLAGMMEVGEDLGRIVSAVYESQLEEGGSHFE